MAILFWIYIGIVGLSVVMLGINLFREEKLINQLNAALVLLPFILRLLLIK